MVATGNPGDDFIIDTYDWVGSFIKNDDDASGVRDIDLSIIHLLSGPVGVTTLSPKAFPSTRMAASIASTTMLPTGRRARMPWST